MGKTVRLTASDGHKLKAYLAGPDPKRTTPTLVLIQEIFGVNKHIRGVCDRFAEQGFTVIAPALFDRVKRGVELGYAQADIQKGRDLRSKIATDDAVRDMAAAAEYVAKAKKRGVIGYCWGGTIAWLGATRLNFDAAVCHYGGAIVDYRHEMPRCPTMIHVGDKDHSIPMKAIRAVQKAHPKLRHYIYKGAGHGFNCEDRADYHPQAAAQAWRRTLPFLKRNLS